MRLRKFQVLGLIFLVLIVAGVAGFPLMRQGAAVIVFNQTDEPITDVELHWSGTRYDFPRIESQSKAESSTPSSTDPEPTGSGPRPDLVLGFRVGQDPPRTLRQSGPYYRDNPDQLVVFVGKGPTGKDYVYKIQLRKAHFYGYEDHSMIVSP
jgi:hypothetical protein